MQFALGFAAALALLSLAIALRVRRWRRFRRGFASSPAPPRGWPLGRLFARLGTSPAQEEVLVGETARVREELAAIRGEWVSLREEIAALVGDPSLEAARVEAVLSSRAERLSEVRRRVAEALARFHAVLDDAQRKALAAMIREGRLLAPARAHRRC